MGDRDSFINRLIGSFKKSEQDTAEKTTQTLGGTGFVVSAFEGFEGEPYTPPKETFVGKVLDLPSKGLESARDYSSYVADLNSAEKSLGLGNVCSYK